MSNFLTVDNDNIAKMCQIYERTAASLKEDVRMLKNWMATQAHLPETMDEKVIENFLFLSKCSIEKTKRSIDMYYTLRTRIPELFGNMNPKTKSMRQMMEIGCWVPLPQQTKEMYRVVCFKIMNKHLVGKMEMVDVAGLIFDLYEIRLKEDIIFGDIIIFDMDGITLGYTLKMTPSLLAKILAAYEKIFSVPMKRLYLLNAPPFVGSVLSLMKAVMKPKLFQRICTCEDTSILNEHFSIEMLPRDYGGQEKSFKELQKMVNSKLGEYQNRFDKLDALKVDESLRPEPLRNDEILGFYGNFKKLDVD